MDREMDTVGARLRSKRESLNLTQSDVAQVLGKLKQAVSSYESGRLELDYESLKKLNEAYGWDLNWILTGKETQFFNGSGRIISRKIIDFVQVPVYDRSVSAGPGEYMIPVEAWEQGQAVLVPSWMMEAHNIERVIGMRVKGDSMTGVQIFNRDLVFYELGLVEGDGIYVVALNEELLVKFLQFDIFNKTVDIISKHSEYKTITVKPDEHQGFRICGKVVGWIHKHPY